MFLLALLLTLSLPSPWGLGMGVVLAVALAVAVVAALRRNPVLDPGSYLKDEMNPNRVSGSYTT